MLETHRVFFIQFANFKFLSSKNNFSCFDIKENYFSPDFFGTKFQIFLVIFQHYYLVIFINFDLKLTLIILFSVLSGLLTEFFPRPPIESTTKENGKSVVLSQGNLSRMEVLWAQITLKKQRTNFALQCQNRQRRRLCQCIEIRC